MSAKEDMEVIQKALDDYEQSLTLPPVYSPGPEAELSSYLNMERKEIEKLTTANCAEIAYRLVQFGFYLRRAYNKECSRIRWCEAKLNEYGSSKQNLQAIAGIFGSHDFKMHALAKENAVIAQILKIKDYSEQRKTRLEGLSYHLESMAKTLKDNQMAKVSEARHE